MKKNIKIFISANRLLILAIGCTLFVSCNKNLLEVPPNSSLSNSDFWKTEADALAGVNGVYNGLWGTNAGGYTDFYGGVWWWEDDITDDGFWVGNANADSYSGWGGIADGAETPLGNNSYNGRAWGGAWNVVSLANNALDKIPDIAFTDADSALKGREIAECKALRALVYHIMVVRWGGVPLLVSKSASATPARSSYDSCVQQIEKDLLEAIPELPLTYTGNDIGRVSKGAAMTFLLDQYMTDHKWTDAAALAQQIMALHVYQLLPAYTDLWKYENKNTIESIFEIQFGDSQGGSLSGWKDGWFPGGTKYGYNGWGGHATPQQQFVNEFESVTIDGNGTIAAASTFNPASIRYLFDTLQYKNRDPRLAASIWYNGADYYGQPYDPNWNTAGSGYNWHKYNTAPLSELRNSNPDYNYIVYRYPYVLLSYAEAQNEALGPDASVYSAVNAVRERAGMPDLAMGLSQDDMRKAIRHETRVEMGGEDHRYEELLRWGMYQQAIANRGLNNGRQGGSVTVADFRLLWPIPQPEMDANPNMKQNPGY